MGLKLKKVRRVVEIAKDKEDAIPTEKEENLTFGAIGEKKIGMPKSCFTTTSVQKTGPISRNNVSRTKVRSNLLI